jgi:hypothetical protein
MSEVLKGIPKEQFFRQQANASGGESRRETAQGFRSASCGQSREQAGTARGRVPNFSGGWQKRRAQNFFLYSEPAQQLLDTFALLNLLEISGHAQKEEEKPATWKEVACSILAAILSIPTEAALLTAEEAAQPAREQAA